MIKYKIICSDIDGTLLNSNRELSVNTLKSIDLLNRKNIPFVMISARMPKAMRPLQTQIKSNYPIVCYNGAYIESEVKDKGAVEQLLSKTIDIPTLKKIIVLLEGTQLHLGTYYKDEWMVNQDDYWTKREKNNTKINPEIRDMDYIYDIFEKRNCGPHKIMIMGDYEKIEPLETELKNAVGDLISIYRSKDTYLELNAKDVSKSTSLDVLSDYLGIPVTEFIAFGDNYNDVSMIEKVGFGVAVGNAREEVKNVADEVVEKNTEDGVAKAIKKYLNEDQI